MLDEIRDLQNLVSNDVWIEPNFDESLFRKFYNQQFEELFPNTYFFFDYHLVKSALKNPNLTSHEIGVGNYSLLTDTFEMAKLELKGDVLFSDGAQHTKLRSVLVRAYTKMYEYIPTLAKTVVEDHFRSLENPRKICITNEIATPIAEKIFLTLSGLGIVSEYKNSSVIFDSFRILLNAIDNRFDQCKNLDLEATWKFLFYHTLEKLRHPNTDYPNLLRSLHDIHELSEEERVIMVLAFIRAGIENPRSFFVSAILRFFKHADLYKQNAYGFLDETMRYDSPAKITARYLREDFEVDGRTLRKGAKIWTSFRIANFSPEIFPKPFSFKLRKPNPHLSFGFGPHFCIGRELTYRVAIEIINSIKINQLELHLISENYRLDPSVVFRRFTEPLYIGR